MENKQKRTSAFLALIFSLLGIAILFVNMLQYKIIVGESTQEFNLALWNIFSDVPSSVWCAILIISVGIIAGILPLLGSFSKKGKEIICTISTILLLLLFCFLVVYREIFNVYAAQDIANYKKCSFGYGSAIAMFLFIAGSLCALLSSGINYGDNVKAITEDGILIALAFVLNFVKIPLGPSGSVNFQMLPLFIIALRRGPVHGFISGGIVYGLMTCLTDGYGFATYPFDYLIGFGSVAVIGIFRKQIFSLKTLYGELILCGSCLLATFIRFLGGTVSSIVVYQYEFVAALTYNALYIPISGALATIVVMLLLPILKILNKRYPVM